MNTRHHKLTSGKLWTIGVVVVLVGLSLWAYHHSRRPVVVLSNPEVLAGMQTGQAPWIAETDNLRARLSTIHLPALTAEGAALHTHQHLDIFIDGKSIPIPSGIGTNPSKGFISDIHTHDTSGIIHVESPRVQTFTLGQFFDIWGVQFTAQSIGGYTTHDDKKLKVYVNGVLYQGNPRELVLETHQEIVVTYGTDLDIPNPLPATYQFTKGL
jgi:hypothetical protein